MFSYFGMSAFPFQIFPVVGLYDLTLFIITSVKLVLWFLKYALWGMVSLMFPCGWAR